MATAAMAASSASLSVTPVGFDGAFTSNSFVFGVMAAFVLSLTLLMALLSFGRRTRDRDPSQSERMRAKGGRRVHAALLAVAEFDLRHRRAILVGFSLLFAASGLGMTRLVVDSNWLEDFSAEMPLRVVTEHVDEVMGGTTNIIYLFDGGGSDAVKEPAVLREIERIQDWADAQDWLVRKTYSIVDIRDEAKLDPGNTEIARSQYIALRNTLSSDRTHMRRHLLPSLLNTVRNNARFLDRVAIFEIGSVYHPQPGQVLPDEPRHLCIVMTGPRETTSWLEGQDRQLLDFYDLKGMVEALCEELGERNVVWERGSHPADHPGRCAQMSVGSEVAGIAGEQGRTVMHLGDATAELGFLLHLGEHVGEEHHLAVV